MKLFRKKEGIGAVEGTILMVAITIAIAATVYVYISGVEKPEPELEVLKKKYVDDTLALQIKIDDELNHKSYDDYHVAVVYYTSEVVPSVDHFSTRVIYTPVDHTIWFDLESSGGDAVHHLQTDFVPGEDNNSEYVVKVFLVPGYDRNIYNIKNNWLPLDTVDKTIVELFEDDCLDVVEFKVYW